MCTQSVGLVAAEVERMGIATACIALVESVARAVRPPRALAVPFRFGMPLGRPDDPAGQRAVLRATLDLLGREGPGPVLARFDDDGGRG